MGPAHPRALHEPPEGKVVEHIRRSSSPLESCPGETGRADQCLGHGRAAPQTRHPARASHSTAPLQLATELSAAVLAGTLGIDTTVAVTWQRAGRW